MFCRLLKAIYTTVPTPTWLDNQVWKYYTKWSKPSDPFTIRWVSPDEINHVTVATQEVDRVQDGDQYPNYTNDNLPYTGVFYSKRAGDRFSGDWDKRQIPFEKYIPFISMKHHFQNDVPWEKTEFYKRVVEWMDKGNPAWGYETKEAFRNCRLSYVDDLYEKIKNKGYKSAAELHSGKDIYDEIELNVGRNGRLFLNDGKHRLIIAKLLDVEQVPIRVIVRHTDFDY